jgi:hypothetical protein
MAMGKSGNTVRVSTAIGSVYVPFDKIIVPNMVTLCDNCEHTIYEDGTNGGIGFNAQRPPEGMKTHCEKKHQIYAPWYMREDNR